MNKWEEEILTKWLPEKLKKGLNETDQYVTLEDVLDLNLDEDTLRKLVSLLDSYNIKVCDDKITKDNRSTLVRDLNYGEIQTSDIQRKDIPQSSEIIYSNSNEIIYEDYSKLDKMLDEVFLPKNLKIKRYKLKNNEQDIVAYVTLKQILKLKLSEVEISHVFKFLEQRDIIVRGKNSTIDFDNYDYVNTYKSSKLSSPDSWDTQLMWFKEYKDLKSKNPSDPEVIRIRNKIVEANYRLVPYVNYKLSLYYGFDINELNSIGKVGLINAVEKFDYSGGHKFSTFAYKCILNEVLREYSKEIGFHALKQYGDVKKAIETINNFYDEMAIDKETSEREIIELLRENGEYTKEKAEEITRVYIDREIDRLSFDEEIYPDENDDYDENDEEFYEDIPKRKYDIAISDVDLFQKQIDKVGLKEDIEEALKTLKPMDAMVITKRYGLDDGYPKTLDEVAKIFGVSKEKIRVIEARAIRTLMHPSRSKKLRTYL